MITPYTYRITVLGGRKFFIHLAACDLFDACADLIHRNSDPDFTLQDPDGNEYSLVNVIGIERMIQ